MFRKCQDQRWHKIGMRDGVALDRVQKTSHLEARQGDVSGSEVETQMEHDGQTVDVKERWQSDNDVVAGEDTRPDLPEVRNQVSMR